jgi:hypothetical protein
MQIQIQLAERPEQILEAYNLVRKVYKKCFNNLDINKLKSKSFKHEVLIAISPENQKVLGTLSFMYPDEDIFPCESSFGFNLKDALIGKNGYVEIGRLATTDECKNHFTVMVSLFLGIAFYLEKRQIHGWVATIKDHIFNHFTRIELPMNQINQAPNLPKRNLLWKYIGDPKTLHLFDIPSEKSIATFKGKYQRYIDNGSVEILL